MFAAFDEDAREAVLVAGWHAVATGADSVEVEHLARALDGAPVPELEGELEVGEESPRLEVPLGAQLRAALDRARAAAGSGPVTVDELRAAL